MPEYGIELYPYQKAWIQDCSPLKIANKSRQIGFSFAAGAGTVLDSEEFPKTPTLILSVGERLSKKFIQKSILPHIEALGEIARYVEYEVPKIAASAHEIRFDNGSEITALPASPESVRGYTGNVKLDEFAHHLDGREIYVAVVPSITLGFGCEIISTPNGEEGMFYEISLEAGLVEGVPAKPNNRWSGHLVDIYMAVDQGCKDQFGKPLDIQKIRDSCIDEDMFLQEYCCKFISTVRDFIPPQLFASCVSDQANGEAPQPDARNCYAGWDIARNRDLSVVWISEMVGDVTITRGIKEFRKIDTPTQVAEVRSLLQTGTIKRICIDQTGMGLPMVEQLAKEFGSKVEGVQFTAASKETLATNAKMRMESHQVRLPDSAIVRNSFRSLKKISSATGHARFDAKADEQFGHADHFWAFALCENAAHNKGDVWLEFMKRKQQKRLAGGE